MVTYNWQVNCAKERKEQDHVIETLLNRYAHILDYQSYSDEIIHFIFSIEEWRIESLYTEISKLMSITGDKPISSESKSECMVYLNVQFDTNSANSSAEAFPDFA